MSIHRLLANHAFTPEETAALVSAYDAALAELGVQKTDDQTSQRVARTIIDLAGHGVRTPDILRDRAVWALSKCAIG
jgi:hypothetical protein